MHLILLEAHASLSDSNLGILLHDRQRDTANMITVFLSKNLQLLWFQVASEITVRNELMMLFFVAIKPHFLLLAIFYQSWIQSSFVC